MLGNTTLGMTPLGALVFYLTIVNLYRGSKTRSQVYLGTRSDAQLYIGTKTIGWV